MMSASPYSLMQRALLMCVICCLYAVSVLAQQSRSHTIAVSGFRVQTNIQVHEGERVSLAASGKIRLGLFAGDSGPGGIEGYKHFNVVSRAKHGALLVRIIGESRWRAVGSNFDFFAGRSGALEFLVNDKRYENNSGSYQVRIKISKVDSPDVITNNVKKMMEDTGLNILFREDYNDNYELDEFKIGHGKLTISTDKEIKLPLLWHIDPLRNYVIELAFKKIKAGAGIFGVVWGADFEIQEKFSGVGVKLKFPDNLLHYGSFTKEEAEAKHIVEFGDKILKRNKDFDTLRIEKTGDQLFVVLNSKTMLIKKAPKFKGHKLIIFTDTKLCVDYIVIRQNQTIDIVPDAPDSLLKQKLSTAVNSEAGEYAPKISADGNTLYFVRRFHPENVIDTTEDIWYSIRQPNGKWGEAKNLGKPINNEDNNVIYSISPDVNSIYLSNPHSYKKTFEQTIGRGWMGLSKRHLDGWTTPKTEPCEGYLVKSSRLQVCIAPDNQTMIISTERNETYGNNDLYVSFLQDNGVWSSPQNLGEIINTLGEEYTPFIAADNSTLYFASDGRPGFGEMDIFIARRLDSTWVNWSKPLNLGPAINTTARETDFTIPANGDYAYYASAPQGGFSLDDIYRVKLPKNARPQPLFLVHGKVLNAKTNEPLGVDIAYENLQSGTKLGTARSQPGTGAYTITLAAGEEYGFLAQRNGFYSEAQTLDARDLAEYTEVERNLYLKPLEVGEEFRLNNLFFDSGTYSLRPTSFSELQRLITLLRENPTMHIEITGYTDNIGSEYNNHELSKNRAWVVHKYLMDNGIDKSRLHSAGYGESQPVETNDTPEGRQRNRRVEFSITKM